MNATTRSFVMPDLGEGLVEAEIVAWLVAAGDEIAVDQPIVELESAKSVVQLPSPYAGVVVALGGEVGQTLHAGDVLVTLAGARAGDAGAADAVEADASGRADASDRADEGARDEGSGAVLIGYGTRASRSVARTERGAGRFGRRTQDAAGSGAPTRVSAGATGNASRDAAQRSPVVSPIVRRLAREHGFDASRLLGSGRDHLVMRRDVERAIAAAELVDAEATAHTDAPEQVNVAEDMARVARSGERRLALDARGRAAAAHFERSRREIPDATVWMDVDASGLLAARSELERASGERFGVTALIARFAIAALARHPRLNAAFDGERREIVLHDDVHLGVAAQTARGLMVPVVHGADRMSLRELRDALGERADQASTGVFAPDALTGGTFTLNNYGSLGVDGSAAILNHPEAAMLGVGRLIERPWVVDGELAVRTVTELTLTFDHRVCDGAEAAAFLTFVAACIEHPLTLLADL
jgi:pyruvate dehydrogenase E2 component (dihydrolipoamide acetyltransferase)